MNPILSDEVAAAAPAVVKTVKRRRLRLTPERKANLDRQWFGWPESLPKPVPHKRPNRPGGVQVTTTCGYCGQGMTLPAAEHNQRLRISRSGKVYCSLACAASGRRKDA